ncbi:MAG: MerR family transcriptional regulator [Alphaproteobacteria bacterium]|nr:MerR family transcriptional regulator [Alphaproteobacteria bacterium]
MALSEKDVVEAVGEISVTRLRAWVRRGWIQPQRAGRRTVYSEVDVARARLVCHLTRELAMAEDELAVVLSLMDQVYGLRRALRNLSRAVDGQPGEVRAEIGRAFRDLQSEA